ncbi:HNH endonuclease [Janibacter anophelis]|uniref:HNH endonuclease n=1 Tax=Janibacter anophelis TaxID=319054 RepID=UPI003F81C7EC
MRPLSRKLFEERLDVEDLGRVSKLLGQFDAEDTGGQSHGGHSRRKVRVRIGQGAFRKKIVQKYGPVCAFTGPAPLPVLDAAHLYSYAHTGKHYDDGGLLLRRDVHRLFDLGYLAVNPSGWTIDVSTELADYQGYVALQGQALNVALTAKQKNWTREHWGAHRAPLLT